MPTDNLSCASSPKPDTMMIAESGTAPNKGRTIPPENKSKYSHLFITLFETVMLSI